MQQNSITVKGGQFPEFEIDGVEYHISFNSETKHITELKTTKIHYFYDTFYITTPEGLMTNLKNASPDKDERGKKGSVKKFTDLPYRVRGFLNKYYQDILELDFGVEKEFTI